MTYVSNYPGDAADLANVIGYDEPDPLDAERTIDVVANPEPKRCQWCGERFESTTAKAIHLHEQHADTIGRGRTRSVAWHCASCGSANRPTAKRCDSCGYVPRSTRISVE